MKDFFQNLPTSRQHIVALAILFVIPLILFFDTTLGGKELQRHDITQWRAGAESIIEYRETYGEEPLWSTNMFAGMPAYVISADSKSVPNLDYLSPLFQSIYPAFQFWVMLSGMYFLLILMGFRPLSAVFGSIMFSTTTYFPVIIIAGHTSKFFALAIIPWVIAGYWKLTRSNNKVAGLLLFTVALVLEVRAGHPQITYYFFYLIGFLWLFDSWNAYRKKELKNWGLITVLLIVGGLAGILGNAERILTLQEYAAYSIRGGSDITGTSGLDSGYAFAWSQGISESLTLLIPDVFGGASPNYWGPKSTTSGPHYLGILALPFILIALFKSRKPLMYLFFGTGTLALFFAWGENFALLNELAFDLIPMFSKFRAPETWLVLTAFCYSVVAVYGLDHFLDMTTKKSFSFKELYVPLGATLGIFVFVFISVSSFTFVKPGEVDLYARQIAQQNQVSPTNPQVQQRAQSIINTRLVPEREDLAKSDLLRMGLFLVLAGGLIFMISGSKIPVGIGSLGLILLLSIDMIGVDKRYIPESNIVAGNIDPERYILSQRRDIDQYIQEHIADGENYPYRVFPLLDNPFSETIPAYFYPIIGGYSGAKLSLFQDVFMAEGNPLFSGQTGINLDLLALMNTKFITYAPGLNLPGLTPVFNGQAGTVYEVNNVLPKAFFADSVITVQTPQEAYEYLFPGKTDLYRNAVVESNGVTSSADSSSSVVVESYTGPEMTIKTSRSVPGFLVLSEMFYPKGWVATLNGEPIEIHKTNYLLRGFEIPAGEHTLELDFRPASYYTGIKISWTIFVFQVGLGLFLLYTFFTQKKSHDKLSSTSE